MTLTSRGSLWRALLTVTFFLLVLGSCSPAVAATAGSNSAAAQALFDQAKEQMAKGNYQDACPKFEESQRLDPTGGTLINLADCYEKLGRFATAWSTFLDAAAASDAAGNTERARVARERAAALVPLLPRLEISVPSESEVSGLEVERDGVAVGTPQWGVPIPIDEGKYQITAKAPSKQSWTMTVEMATKGQTVTVAIPLLEASASPAATPNAAGAGAVLVPPPPPVAAPGGEDSPELGTQRILALAAGGVGVVGVAVGSVCGLVSMGKAHDADECCDGSACRDDKGVKLRADAISAGDVSTVGFIVGAVGLAGGAVLWFTVPPDPEMAGSPSVGVGPGTLVFKGSW